MVYVIFFLSFLLFLLLGIGFTLKLEKGKAEYRKQKKILLSITVSKTNELGPLAAEQMFASLHGLFREVGLKERLEGKLQEYFSFEVANTNQEIRFYVWLPEHIREFVEGQVHAQYPDVEIIEQADYAFGVDENQYHFAGNELCLEKPYYFPIKSTAEFSEKTLDPLSATLSAIGKIDPDDQAWMQVICRPAQPDWQEKGLVYVEDLKAGKATKKSLLCSPIFRVIAFPFRIIYTVLSFLFNPSGSGDSGAEKSAAKLTDTQQISCKAIVEKATKLGFEVAVRMIYAAKSAGTAQIAKARLQAITGTFKQFSTTNLNGFKAKTISGKEALYRYRQRAMIFPMILNTEELATIFHLPNDTVKVPNIAWVTSRKFEPPLNLPTPANFPEKDLTIIGETDYRGQRKRFGLKPVDRARHVYILGKTGMGKSVLLENMVHSEIQAGKGLCIVDPHGDTAEAALKSIPPHRVEDTILFDPSDVMHPIAFNPFEGVNPENRNLVASGILGIFKKIYGEVSWGPRMEYVLRNTILALVENPGSTMLGITRMLVDSEYREKILANVTDPLVKAFWYDEFAKIQPRNLQEVVSPIQNKVGQFLQSKVIRNIVGQPKGAIDFRKAMDEKKIVICNLSRGKLGDDNAALLGAMIITKIQLDAMSRADVPEEKRVDFTLFVDEFQNFATDAFAHILSEARKYHLSLVMANQYIAQMPDMVRDAVFGNVGTIVTFQVGYDDAKYLTKQFKEIASDDDLVGISKYHIYTNLLIDGHPSNAFSAATLPPPSREAKFNQNEITRELTRKKYSKPRESVEAEIAKWAESSRTAQMTAASVSGTPGVVSGGAGGVRQVILSPEEIAKIIQSIKAGEVYEVEVNKMVNFGIFVNYKGVHGLIHTSELPLEILANLKNYKKPGDKLKAMLTDITNENKLVFSVKKMVSTEKKKDDKGHSRDSGLRGAVLHSPSKHSGKTPSKSHYRSKLPSPPKNFKSAIHGAHKESVATKTLVTKEEGFDIPLAED